MWLRDAALRNDIPELRGVVLDSPGQASPLELGQEAELTDLRELH